MISDQSVEPPLIFIHYGPADYLRRTLLCARDSNPAKRVVLLGDESNRRFVGSRVDFVPLAELAGSEKEKEFEKLFRPIQGERHRFNKANGVDFWLKFVFRRWFLIEAFLEREGLDSFWTFDSDTLVLCDLALQAQRFHGFEAMTQCNDQCLNGWVGSRKLVSRYTQSILDQFGDEEYLASQVERLKLNAGLAFNEMDAFAEFRRRECVRTIHGQVPVDEEIFDNALAFTEGFEIASQKVLGKTAIKRLWTDGCNIYARHLPTGNFVRLLTCNMSWMPDFMWRRIRAAAKVGSCGSRVASGGSQTSKLKEISTKEPILDMVVRKAKLLIWNAMVVIK